MKSLNNFRNMIRAASLMLILALFSTVSFSQTHNSSWTTLSQQWPNLHYFDAISLNKGNKMFLGGRNSAGYLSWGAYPDNTPSHAARFWATGVHAGQIIYSSWGKSMEFRFSNPNISPSGGQQVEWQTAMHISNGGRVAIGTTNTPAGYKLYVKDGILTEKVKVAVVGSSEWSDYVFLPSYELLSLEEVEDHIQENGHLHKTPSAVSIAEEGGFELKEMTINQQEKIEELYLHMIEMNKRLKEVEQENVSLHAKIKELSTE